MALQTAAAFGVRFRLRLINPVTAQERNLTTTYPNR